MTIYWIKNTAKKSSIVKYYYKLNITVFCLYFLNVIYSCDGIFSIITPVFSVT